jgi:predicted RNase H-like HicB family nuclease
MVMSRESKVFNRIEPANRPFEPAIARRAAELARLYQVIIQWDPVENCFAGRAVEIPGAVGFAQTESKCLEEVRGNIKAIVGFMLERGEKPPLSDEPERTNQINVRFADYEKAAAEALAAASGLSLSEHIRRAALKGV